MWHIGITNYITDIKPHYPTIVKLRINTCTVNLRQNMAKTIQYIKWYQQKCDAASRNIEFYLTLDEWTDWWGSDFLRRGNKKDDLCMCRYGDKGHYELGNIYKATMSQNHKDFHAHCTTYIRSGGPRGIRASVKVSTSEGVFNNLYEAAEYFGIDSTTVRRRVISNNKQFIDWDWIYEPKPKKKPNIITAKKKPKKEYIMAAKRNTRPTDLIENAQYNAWAICKNAAKRNGLEWEITFNHYKMIWNGKWDRHGSFANCLILQRINVKKGWTLDNIELCNKKSNSRTYRDPLKHKQFTAWMRMKAQAIFRKEEWDLSFEEFLTLWTPYWSRRGRASTAYCLSRTDPALSWSITNTTAMIRRDQLIKAQLTGARRGRKC